MSSSSSNLEIHYMHGSGGLSCEDISMASSIKLQPGMKEVKEWLKSLRLHKYTALLESMSYDEMLGLTEKGLEEREVTLGARGKILKSIQQVKDRPIIIKDLNDKLDSLASKFDLFPILTELEFVLLMPLKPYEYPSSTNVVVVGSDLSETSSSPICRPSSNMGLEISLTNISSSTPYFYSGEDIPGQLFDLLRKINAHLRVGGESLDAVTIFVCFLERCRKQDGFTLPQKQFFLSWAQKLRAIWNPPTIKRVSDLNKRRFSRESLIRRSSIRSPTQLTVGGSNLGSYTPRGPSPISHFPPSMVVTTPTPPPIPIVEITSDPGGIASGRLPIINLPPEEPPGMIGSNSLNSYCHRKSPSEIKSPSSIGGGFGHSSTKRISYQGDLNSISGAVSGSGSLSSSPLIPDDDNDDDDSLGLMPNFVDPGLLPFQISSSAGFRSRRESSESRDSGYYLSLPDSRRNSSMSSTSSDSRRESAFSFDGSYFEGSRSSSFLLPSSATSPIYHPELRRESSSDYFSDRRESTASSVSDYYYMDLRRDSDAFPNSVAEVPNEDGGSSIPSFVVSPSSPTLGVPTTHSSTSLSGKGANSVSSGCLSDDGSMHSLIEPDLEQHMANISLSVTEQVLD
ncbi:uncharacterized protein smg [Lepeophtheirus salmonis]|uniref:uncharacterized protein smg n=1 Tax=Lepeophtheirus salmonis TaxID=72036 RepID=UPI001AEA3DA5|nr:uncharacterized protein LOC121115270 [Lepeophtheirus salmonis]